MARIIKSILLLHHEQAPPHAELQTLNPKLQDVVDATGCAMHFPKEQGQFLRQFSSKAEGTLLVAGISSFGYAGTIAHAIISQADPAHRRRLGVRGEAGSKNSEPKLSLRGSEWRLGCKVESCGEWRESIGE